MTNSEIDKIKLVSATYLHDYVIRFVFSDGKIHDLDFFPFISKVPQNQMVSKYLNINLFKKFEILNKHHISWNEREMCYNFFTLYFGFEQGQIEEERYDRNNSPIYVHNAQLEHA